MLLKRFLVTGIVLLLSHPVLGRALSAGIPDQELLNPPHPTRQPVAQWCRHVPPRGPAGSARHGRGGGGPGCRAELCPGQAAALESRQGRPGLQPGHCGIPGQFLFLHLLMC